MNFMPDEATIQRVREAAVVATRDEPLRPSKLVQWVSSALRVSDEDVRLSLWAGLDAGWLTLLRDARLQAE